MNLETLREIILDESRDTDVQRAALDWFARECASHGGVEPDRSFDAHSGDSLLATGVAINPRAAAHCVADYRRTVVFLRGVEAALREAQRRFAGQPLNVLYAGCGPYATLLLPLLGAFDPAGLQLTLLDVHRQSLDSVGRLLRHFALGHYPLRLLQVDASEYDVDVAPHLVIVETMQKALEQEPQVALTDRLAPQLVDGGLFVPQRIDVELVLRGDRDQYRLGTLLSLDPERPFPDSPVRVTVPAVPMVERMTASLITSIRVHGSHSLADSESEVTLPRPFPELRPLRPGQVWELRYQRGPYPCFEATAVPG